MPNGTTGVRCLAQSATTALTSSVVSGKTTKSGRPGGCHDSPWLWCSRTESEVETRSPKRARSSEITEAFYGTRLEHACMPHGLRGCGRHTRELLRVRHDEDRLD